jgi:hypothetical protein
MEREKKTDTREKKIKIRFKKKQLKRRGKFPTIEKMCGKTRCIFTLRRRCRVAIFNAMEKLFLLLLLFLFFYVEVS